MLVVYVPKRSRNIVPENIVRQENVVESECLLTEMMIYQRAMDSIPQLTPTFRKSIMMKRIHELEKSKFQQEGGQTVWFSGNSRVLLNTDIIQCLW
jgi:hypothetical protein